MGDRCSGHLTSQLTASVNHQVWESLSHNHPAEPINPELRERNIKEHYFNATSFGVIFYVAVTGHWLSDGTVQKAQLAHGRTRPVSVSSKGNPMTLSYFLWFLGWVSLSGFCPSPLCNGQAETLARGA